MPVKLYRMDGWMDGVMDGSGMMMYACLGCHVQTSRLSTQNYTYTKAGWCRYGPVQMAAV